MKKFVLACLMVAMILPLAFSQEKITSLEKTEVTISALKSGHVSIKTANNEIFLTPDNREQFLKILKAHAEFLQSVSTDKIEIERIAFTGTLPTSIVSKVDFRLYVNSYKDNPYVFEMDIGHDTIGLTLDGLNQFIKIIESTKATADGYSDQSKKLERMITDLRTVFN